MDIKQPEYLTLKAEIQQRVTAEQAWHYRIIPAETGDGFIKIFIDETKNFPHINDELELLFNMKVVLEPAPQEVILKTLGRYYRRSESNKKVKSPVLNENLAEDFLFSLIDEAKSINSSDIHIEPTENKARIRLRIDGKLIERFVVNKADYPALINRIKIKANLDISEKRLPQDGRILFKSAQESIDMRVSVLPTLHGEKVVLRLLNKNAANITIDELGFSEPQLSHYLQGIRKTSGIVLISGPTGSGKTTTLYATLKVLNEEKTNILTIEDPIEYTLEGVNQVQLRENIGLTFASALRTFLRQDPDIIMLGEVRDAETAQMAIRAALTGHLVLTTIHTNSALGTITRLIDMGIPSYLLAGTINLSVAQRLLRLLCPHCKTKDSFKQGSLPFNYIPKKKPEYEWNAAGCEKCYYTGYKGRKAVYEVIPINSEISEMIKCNHINRDEIMEQMKIASMAEQAFDLFINGETTIEEIFPVLLIY